MENEEDEIFTTFEGGYEGQEDVEEQEEEEEEQEEEEQEAKRKSSWDVPIPSRSLASRRASLPCPVSTQYKFVCVCRLYGIQAFKWEQKHQLLWCQALDFSSRQPTSS